MKFEPHQYQKDAISFLTGRLFGEQREGAGLFLDPGLGKTAITLTTIDTLRSFGEVERVLVVAPLRPVYSVWPKEIEKWGFDLQFSIIHGTPTKRLKAMNQAVDIHLINPEGLAWLAKQDHPTWDLMVVDESTKFKNWTAGRTKALRKLVGKIDRRIILTGTPAPNCVSDLFSQIFMLDKGETLGENITQFRKRYMKRGGYENYKWLPKDEHVSGEIAKKTAPVVLTMDAEDHLDMPEILYNDIRVHLSPGDHSDYKKLEQKLFLELDSGHELVASGAGSAYSMAKGFANGGVYETHDETRTTHQIHTEKLEAFADLVDELQSKPCLVAFEFLHDLERIHSRFPNAPAIVGATDPQTTDKYIEKFNKGELPMLLAQSSTIANGMNMQESCNEIIRFGLTDKYEDYEQFNRRVYRQGVSGQVRVHHILTTGTVDEVRRARLDGKADRQKSLVESLKEYKDAGEQVYR